LDLAKYRAVFLEEASECLEEMSRALLELEKDGGRAEAIDAVFRTAHSVKGMAASLEYDSITRAAHALEDRVAEMRRAGRVGGAEELALLFRGLDALDAMVTAVRETGEPPPHAPGSESALAAAPDAGAKKKAPTP
jgi:two-component system chemotaxis sensor kinase CheA